MNLRYKLAQLVVFARDSRYLPFFLQRRVRSNAARNRISELVAGSRPAIGPSDHKVGSLVAVLKQDGILHLGDLLTNKQVAEILAYFEGLPVTDPYQTGEAPFLPRAIDRPPQTHVGYHDAAHVLAAPHLLALVNRPDILAIAASFLGCKPTIGYLASWWSFASGDGTAQAAENFHRDVDDWRFLKLFVYLTDVGPENGPHVYVTGSAEDERLRKIRRYTDQEVFDTFGESAVITNTGNAGSGFLENTYGIHKGQPVGQGYRVLFQAVYTMSPLPYAPKSPVGSLAEARTQTGMALDSYVNRLYLKEGAAR